MDSPPTAIPWYHSQMFHGLLIIVVSRVLAHLGAQYHIDFAALGLTPEQVADYITDAVAAVGVAYIARARITQKSAPAITLTKAAAVKANAPLVEPPQEKPQ